MTKRTFLTGLAVLALASVSHAQFTFRTAEGKVISDKSAPSYRTSYSRTSNGPKVVGDEVYLTWEKERVKIVVAMCNGNDKPIRVSEYYLYYSTFSEKNTKKTKSGNGDEIELEYRVPYEPKLVNGNPEPNLDKYLPYYAYYDDRTTGGMTNELTLTFPTAAELDAFVAKVEEKKFDLSLDLDFTPGPKLVVAAYEFRSDSDSPTPRPTDSAAPEKPKTQDPTTPAPAPKPAPKAKVEVVVKLYNKSNNPIELIVKDYPKGSGGTIFTLNSRTSRRYTIRVGGEVRAKATGALLLTVTDKMDDTEQVIAR